jgi:hypothetical protein
MPNQPATIPLANSPTITKYDSNTLPRSGLVQQAVSGNPAKSNVYQSFRPPLASFRFS